jgi:hypothetical protein
MRTTPWWLWAAQVFVGQVGKRVSGEREEKSSRDGWDTKKKRGTVLLRVKWPLKIHEGSTILLVLLRLEDRWARARRRRE